MASTVNTGNNTGLPDGLKIADNADSNGDKVQRVQIDLLSAAGAAPNPVTSSNPLPISGSVGITNFPASQAVSDGGGSLTVDGSVAVSNFPATQPVSAAALPLPAGASTEATLALIKAKTDNLDVLLSTRTKPADTQAVSAAALPLPAGASTEATQALVKAKTDNLDVLLSTRLKPADTLAAVTALGSITGALPAGTNRIGSVRPVDSADADLTAAKGSQSARALGTQDLKDAGRSAVMITVEALAGAIAEALATLTWSKGYAAVTTGTSYNVTAGKTLRLQALVISFIATTTTANTTRIRLRVNPAGAALLTSALQFSIRIAWPSATFIANEAYTIVIPFPDGIEIPGGGGLAISHIEAAANGTIDISLSGYEY